MMTTESKEEYTKFGGFVKWMIETKAIGVHKGWVKALDKDSEIDGKGEDDGKSKMAVMMKDLAYHHLVMSCIDKAFF